MTLKLYAHPLSSYCQKVLIALYENGTPFEYLTLDDAKNGAELEALWPIKKFPVLVDGGRTTLEASIIIEHLDLHHPGPLRLIPEDPGTALDVRLMDRFFDNYIMTPMQKIVADRIRSEQDRDLYGVKEARAMLDKAYGWLDETLAGREWAAGAMFSLADCAAAPSLFYSDWAHPIADRFSRVREYRRKLLAQPSFCKGGRRGPALPFVLPTRRAGPRLTHGRNATEAASLRWRSRSPTAMKARSKSGKNP